MITYRYNQRKDHYHQIDFLHVAKIDRTACMHQNICENRIFHVDRATVYANPILACVCISRSTVKRKSRKKKTQNSISLCPETPTLEFRSRRHRRHLKPLSLPSSSLETTGKSVRVGGGEAAGSMRKGEGASDPSFPSLPSVDSHTWEVERRPDQHQRGRGRRISSQIK